MQWLLAVFSLVTLTALGARPGVISRVSPAEESASVEVQVIEVEMNFSQAGGMDPTSVKLFVDGADVTPQTEIKMTRDWPPSHVSVRYTPKHLPPGRHTATIRLPANTQGMLDYTWTFTVARSSN